VLGAVVTLAVTALSIRALAERSPLPDPEPEEE
jgi:hypothetical protein